MILQNLKNGKILAKLLNRVEENLIDERAINMEINLS